MEAFYEDYRENDKSISVSPVGTNHEFSPHFHNNVELFIIKKGEYLLCLNGENFVAKSGSICIFDSYDIHGYLKKLSNENIDRVMIIPIKYLEKFNAFKGKKRIANHLIESSNLVDGIIEIIDRILLFSKNDNTVSACIDLIFSLLEEKLVLSDYDKGEEISLIKKILGFIHKNVKEDVSLTTMAKELGYTKEHLSRTFHKYFNTSIPVYVNNIRLSYIDKQLKTTDKKITALIYEAGFKSIQSYYRNKNKRA